MSFRQSSMPGMVVFEDAAGTEAQVMLLPDTAYITAAHGIGFTARDLRRLADVLESPGRAECPFDFSHTRHWCGYLLCRDS